ncbi:peptide deformylase [Undibacterium flavidum]|uniref:Peptide deformylase n=1 Tax=Undibacterium flavidum TaxID=2762297 RepID=A0ABR6Y7Z4_9BURK|nr:peptide deformylase [Undibacterium flavidum]MBC3872733.1 peptide deformylase [Undibacterium flavidum]
MLPSVLPLDDVRLRRHSVDVDDCHDLQFQQENQTLQATLNVFRAQHGFGRGIAAPQLGIAKRFIALNLGEGTFSMINPKITWRSEQTFTMWDDCMCFPELLVKVRRHLSISVQFIDEKGRQQSWEHLGQSLAELLQHEIDHLDGVLATDLALDEHSIIQRRDFDANPERFHQQVDYVIVPTLG